MTSNFDDSGNSNDDANSIDSPEYREKVMRKLNCLIAVLDVACTKVRRSLAGDSPDIERLTRIQDNLTRTLKVCRKAKLALERREALPEDLPPSLKGVVGDMHNNQKAQSAKSKTFFPTGAYIEMSSNKEAKKFRDLGPIDREEVSAVDFDQLASQLQSE
ncbi:MAG: hypothetical protein ACJAZ8_001976 [Planctomycetota bacterium]|jgi:hypothetical protein